MSETDGVFRIETTIDGIEIKFVRYGYYEVFQELRDKLLELGYGLKCNGSRINTIQSNMMGSCEKIYLAFANIWVRLKSVGEILLIRVCTRNSYTFFTYSSLSD